MSVLHGMDWSVVLFWAWAVGVMLLASFAVIRMHLAVNDVKKPASPAPEPPALCKRAKVLWVDGQPTMSYSIMRRPGHWLN